MKTKFWQFMSKNIPLDRLEGSVLHFRDQKQYHLDSNSITVTARAFFWPFPISPFLPYILFSISLAFRLTFYSNILII